ncbi:MAG TPA: tetratricopeptide repeat protein [Steroidobacteraceae bacterium]|nr:tetratricopeptide repeat protein [Steroidobacteraceae bacterium]
MSSERWRPAAAWLIVLYTQLAWGSAEPTAPTPASPVAPTPAPAVEMRLPVAPAATETGPAPQAPETLSGSDAFAEFRGAFDAGRYAAAVPFAQRVLQLAEADARTPVDEEVQVALMNLAMTQYLSGDYVGAESSYARAIELVEAAGRPLHARLARAYAGLAAAYHETNRHELAVQNFQQAVALTRRHEGLLTEAQVPLLEKYVDSLTELGRYPEALQGWKYVMRIATRKYGDNSPALAPTLERIGRWYTQVGLYEQARRTLRRAIDLVEAAEGARSVKLIGPLTALAACNRRQLIDPKQNLFSSPDAERATMYHEPGLGSAASVSSTALMSEGERALLRAAEIAEARAEASPVQVADVRTQVGDWYQSRGLAERALPNYQKAWAAASKVKQQHEGRPIVEALFGQPVLLQIVRPDGWDKFASRSPEEVETRSVVVELTVNTEGRAEQVRVIDDSGDERRAQKTTEALETARYRPRMENGAPVATAGISFTQLWILPLQRDDDPRPQGSKEDGTAKSDAAT